MNRELLRSLLLPAMRQQLVDSAVELRRQPRQNVFQISIRIKAIDIGALNQTHRGSGTLPRSLAACK
jgi:hypothetical protein